MKNEKEGSVFRGSGLYEVEPRRARFNLVRPKDDALASVCNL